MNHRAETTPPSRDPRPPDGRPPVGAGFRDGTDPLAERVARELSAAWGRGDRRPAEEFLASHPDVVGRPAAAARVIYEEICLREGLGQAPGSSEILGRFPQWRAELRVLLDCHRLVQPPSPLPPLPGIGETLGDYTLRAVLGRGIRGCVFLATQQSLADRPVVLKVTRSRGGEHLSLARLQHPNVVPLYAFHEFPDLDLRALCLPYLGGVTFDRALVRLGQIGPSRLSGVDLLRVLDEARTEYLVAPAWSGARQFLSGVSYPRAVCWFGASLADALHYAHERQLVHLDVKPSNILLADDGQPMLLDFHLASGPLGPGAERPEHLGGTPGYMSPEQAAAMAAVRASRPIPSAVDGRSDIYSLGVVLFESLTGTLPPPPARGADPDPRVLRALRANPGVGGSLAQIVARCLAHDPAARFPEAGALALALKGHLGGHPYREPGASRVGRLGGWVLRGLRWGSR